MNPLTASDTLPILECYLCREETAGLDVYTVNGTEVYVGIVKARLLVFTKEHRPIHGVPEGFEFKRALLKWLDAHARFSEKVLPYLQFGAMSRSSSAHVSEHRLYPPLVPVSAGTQQMESWYEPGVVDGWRHPKMALNVFELLHHQELPLLVSDQYVKVAQEFSGYFFGKRVEVSQMANLNVAGPERGLYDPSVRVTDDPWVEPFELSDDCAFCRRMTDESVEERVAGFQWEIDKESAGRISGVQGAPTHSAFGVTADARRDYHDRLNELVREKPWVWRPLPLIDLPHGLKYMMCVRWNHVFRDWLREDPRYVYVDGKYYVVWTERLGGIDQRPTRSDTYGADAAYGAWGIPNPLPYDQPPPPSYESDERDIWLG